MDKTRRVFTTELNGNWVFQAGGVLNCNLKFDGATNTSNLRGSVTGVSLLSVLRQAVPLGKFPSQLERLQVCHWAPSAVAYARARNYASQVIGMLQDTCIQASTHTRAFARTEACVRTHTAAGYWGEHDPDQRQGRAH